MRLLVFCLLFTALSFSCVPTKSIKNEESMSHLRIESGIGTYDTKRDGKKKEISSGGIFVLIEEKADNVWAINKISKNPITRENLQQEILYVKDINSRFTSIETYYEDHEIAFFKGRDLGIPDKYFFDCTAKNQNKPSYNPCNSRLTSTHTMGLIHYGPGAFRLIDRDKIAEIIKQIDMVNVYAAELRLERERIEEEKEECRKLQSIAREFIDKIIVEPIIIDKSGFYVGEKIVDVSKKIANTLTCPVNLNNVKYSVSININDNHFATNIEPKHYEFKYNSEGYFLKPIVTIVARTFEDIFPKYINEDNSLRIEFNGRGIRFLNKTNNFLQVKSISIYYNGEISNFSFGDKALELAPQATTKEPLLIKSYATIEIIAKSVYPDMTKSSAMKQNLSFGFAIKYRVVEQNIDRTLYKQNEYNLYKIVSSL